MSPSFKVLIAGAGVGGVTLAILLERAKIDYELFEGAPDVTSIGGAAIVLGPTVMPLFEQLGLLPRLKEVSKIVNTLHLNQENMKRIGEIDLSDHKDQTGYNSVVVARPDLLSILIAQIPARKIHFSKRIVSFTANKNDVIIRCQDDTTFKGQLLVGADGAFSTVREVLYRHMAKKGILPRTDAAVVAVDNQHQHAVGRYTAWMGVSGPLDVNVEQFSALKEQDGRCDIVLGDNVPYSRHVRRVKKKAPPVYLAGKPTTTSLTNAGDACHRMIPNTAHQGAVNGIHDAVALANLIHDLPSASAENLVLLFKEFHALRYPLTKTQMQMDRKANKMLRGQSWTESLMRKLLVRYMSKIYQHFGDAKLLANRPQATFMPLINSHGNITALPQMEHKVFGGDRQSKHQR
ncbi:hypothetical protein BG011_004380 [Mortierella polycephala]|uniref:FAD-binding domain-containing protein n=1 Tax=Mortierella polycephala TaxID=41804 RepID=A0A9P6Q1S9_9FUNG|nr:hypothetical protein BG011_004380 [Mortierella polycephala]